MIFFKSRESVMCNEQNSVFKKGILRFSSLLITIFSILALYFVSYYSVVYASNPHKTIGITQIVEHPALDAVRAGVLEALQGQGFEEGKNLTVIYDNAQGNMVTATQVADKFLSMPLDVIVAISTPSAQTVFNKAKRMHKHVPIVFSAVSDVKAAKLEAGVGEIAYPITGITDTPNLKAVLTVMQKMLPQLKKIGIVYNPSETNSVAAVWQLKSLLKEKGIAVQERTVTKTTEVAQAVHSLTGKVDALYFPQDNTIVSAIEMVSENATMPTFCSDPLLVEKGILAGIGFDYKTVGLETGKMVGKLLEGETVQQLPAHSPALLKAVVSEALARKWQLTVPARIENIEVTVLK